MRTETLAGAADAQASADLADTAAALVNAATGEAVAKPAAKRAKPSAKPSAKQAAKPAQPDARTAERAIAAQTVAAYYTGLSLPFKSAHDRFADLRLDKPAKRPSVRQAALIAAMLVADTAGNIGRNGQFKRGGFRVPARLLDPKAPADAMLSVQPETGCLSDMLGRTVHYVSGPTSGKLQADTVLRLDFKAARADLALLGGKLARDALAKLDKLGAAKAA